VNSAKKKITSMVIDNIPFISLITNKLNDNNSELITGSGEN